MSGLRAILQQRTFGSYGHFLNHRQALSHCGRYLYYDTRNADPDIAKATRIESLDLVDGTVRVIYDTQSDSAHGPGVGAVVCHPLCSAVLFIHGLTNCDESRPYSITRRFGALASFDPQDPVVSICALESRTLDSLVPFGTLRGGTHAHSFSGDGRWVSFTYNDVHKPERRSVGFAMVEQWLKQDHCDQAPAKPRFEERFQGVGWAALALIPEDPILSAREECWVEQHVGGAVVRGLAMIVKVATGGSDPSSIDEIYFARFPSDARDWPTKLSKDTSNLIDSGAWGTPIPPGMQLRRLTYTQNARYPGVQGPRHWLIASGCGNWIYSMMKDDWGVVRLVRVSVSDGSIEWISGNQESITHPIAIDRKGDRISYLIEKRLMIVDLLSGTESQVSWDSSVLGEIVGPVQFLGDDQGVFFNARPAGREWLEIWTATLQ